jgi:quinoprotein glucose dehydrogenase
LKDLKLPRLGATRNLLSGSGPLITRTLLFMNQVQTQGMFYSGTGYFLRAFDKRTGKVVWEQQMQEPPNSIPMTYEHNGKQYIVVATGGGGVPAKLQAFALP